MVKLQDEKFPLNLSSKSTKKRKRVEIEKKEGEHGPKKIYNPDKPIFMSESYKKEKGIPVGQEHSIPKSQFIREGHRKSDIKGDLALLGLKAGLFGGIFGGMVTLDKKIK